MNGSSFPNAFLDREYWKVVMVPLCFVCGIVEQANAQSDNLPSKVAVRIQLKSSANDELLLELEKDFLELLKTSKNHEELLEAEELLNETNDNTHWTNFSKATKILRGSHDLAAVPLLLRFIILHSKRSASHIMLPEYIRTIGLIAGKELPDFYQAGPDLEERMRVRVQSLCNDWWRSAKSTLVTDPSKMTDEQLRIIAEKLLKQVRYDGDFSGSGGRRDTAYGAYHNVYYRLKSNDAAERHKIEPLQPGMLPLFLAPSGYLKDDLKIAQSTPQEFPYEAVIILSEYAKKIDANAIKTIARNTAQNSTVRMVALLALYRAGYPYETEQILQILSTESDLERRLILLLSLRWGDERATAVLLKYMDDENAEIATAAASGLIDAQPSEAIPKIKKLFDRNFEEPPLMLLTTLSAFKSREGRELVEQLLIQALEGKRNSRHLMRLLYAFTDSWEVPRELFRRSDDRDYEKQARMALDYCRERAQREQVELRRQAAVVESLKTQLRVAMDIEGMRREEYKRLLSLQGDDVVTADESKRAHEQLRAAGVEVESFRAILRDKESMLQSSKKWAR